jgi:hypothetical protein
MAKISTCKIHLCKKIKTMANVADTVPRPTTRGTYVDDEGRKWIVKEVISQSANELVLDVVEDPKADTGNGDERFYPPKSIMHD